MCGLVGIFGYHPEAPAVDRVELETIRDAMAARGPDDRGTWISSAGRVGLAHRRLSIIDPRPEGAQPMASADGSRVLVYNGEIYNYRTLRKQLVTEGVAFRSQSDTEVLLELYDRHGEQLFDRVRGMYAFALWDERRGALLLGRDPYGIKPLYYADDGRTVRVASQVKALLAGGRVARRSDPAAKVGFLLLGSVPEPYTPYRQVRALPAGSSLWVDEHGPATVRKTFSIAEVFRSAAERARELPATELQAEVTAALVDSVEHHQVADVPVGAFLSAGVDSGALVGLMRLLLLGILTDI
ncbi:MAG: asparagine synthetase B [Deltaproteobacteria bacterium]|jgi:asparagine synthase (glutamine-hydrolysing)|nr:asparagine synthetase B [Deltaproteobacteria bacterium]